MQRLTKSLRNWEENRMVEWKKLGEVCSRITDGSHSSPTAVEKGYYMPSVKDMTNNGFNFSSCKIISEEDYNNLVKTGCKPEIGDVLISKDGSMLKYVFPVLKDYDIVLLSSIAILTPIQKYVNSKYLSHYLRGDDIKEKTIREFSSKGGVPRIILKNFKKILIPIPSLSEQNRIVGILDTFTDSIENLKQQIAQRRKQYEFYRNQLLDLEGKEGVEMKVSDFCLLKAGKSISANEINDKKNDANYPCYGGNGIRGYVPFNSHQGNFPIIGRQGALCGCVAWASGKFYATEHAVVASGKKETNQRFLFYLFQKANLNQYKSQGAQPGLSVAKLNELFFYIPPLSEQSRIVSILDTFESSISNLEAQLAQRQKQYEYYRNKLLSFGNGDGES